jgi:Na+/H+ antiporter NhaD/arsenite permease-like protein
MPLVAPKFWHHYFPAISAFWALSFAIPFLFFFGHVAWHEILHIYLVDYIPFIILLWGLYTISGGILIEGTLKGKPLLNTGILLFGTLIASWIGTTGASMLLIRPILRANAWRTRKVHVVIFFIFLVSNIGGALTPLGDPPLFLGFLHGVSFFWTLELLPHMALMTLLLLSLFFLVDSFYYRREKKKDSVAEEERIPFRILGLHNGLFLLGVVGAVLASGLLDMGQVNVLGVHLTGQSLLRDGVIVAMGILSLRTTQKLIRKKNEFSWFPIKEVAYLFAGIFMTIIPALAILKAGTNGELGFIVEKVTTPAHYFWVTGLLSSFLDNAPTYLTFLNTSLGTFYSHLPEAEAIQKLMVEKTVYLQAISAGAVFMGANTYIGNAANFMVKSIAEESGVPMPSFFGYMFKYSLPLLFPIFVFITIASFLLASV